MRQLIEDLISMMEYHVEQTRPIHTTTVALQAAREALKSLPAPVQEPVASLLLQSKQTFEHNFGPSSAADWIYSDIAELMGTTPPAAQRQWVGLTDEQVTRLCKTGAVYAPDGVVTRTPLQYREELENVARTAVRKAEAKLKEKNT
jgi:hypothetical protein